MSAPAEPVEIPAFVTLAEPADPPEASAAQIEVEASSLPVSGEREVLSTALAALTAEWRWWRGAQALPRSGHRLSKGKIKARYARAARRLRRFRPFAVLIGS